MCQNAKQYFEEALIKYMCSIEHRNYSPFKDDELPSINKIEDNLERHF